MKTEQIILALNIAREKSITKAADELFISQPTASNMLKSLENELGYSLFTRTRSGIELTEDGEAFVEYASTIERSLNAISQIKNHKKLVSLKIVSLRNDFSDLAFVKLCSKHYSGNTIDFGFQVIDDPDYGIKMIENGICDIAILMCGKNLYETLKQNEAEKGLSITPIIDKPVELTCCNGHPILKDGVIAFDLFSHYPCITSVHNSLSALYVPYYLEKHGIKLNSCLTVSPGFRYLLMKQTNAFLLSWPITEKIKEDYDLISAPLEGTDLCSYALYRKNSINEKLIDEYISYCKSFTE